MAPPTKEGEEPKPAPPHLPIGPGYSRRAVRLRFLDHTAVTHIKIQAAQEVTADMKMPQYDDIVATYGIEQMIEAFTEPVDPAQFLTAEWKSTSPEKTHELLKSGKTFTTKDFEVMKQIYMMQHHVNPAEVNAIVEGMFGFVV